MHLGLASSVVDRRRKLEYIGDTVLDLRVREYVVGEFPLLTVGNLSWIVEKVVSNANLAKIARRLKLRNPTDTLAIAKRMEVIIGKLYFHYGLAVAKDFVDFYIIDKERMLEISDSYAPYLEKQKNITDRQNAAKKKSGKGR